MVTCEDCGNTGYPKYAESTVRCRHCGGRVRPATPEEVRRNGLEAEQANAE
jgi:DNA-directed RNA polymerase subunit RPC12/RpoP